jgi:exo-poly-alpha-galacturonosidase
MKRNSIIAVISIAFFVFAFSASGINGAGNAGTAGVPVNVRVPALAFSDSEISIVWNKPDDYSRIRDYRVYMNGKLIGGAEKNNSENSPAKTYIDRFYADDKDGFHVRVYMHNFTVKGLSPDTSYRFTVRSVFDDGKESADSAPCVQKTASKPKIFDIRDFGAKGDGVTVNTSAIQSAIDACAHGGVVLVSKGVYVSGALFLKSDMTLRIDEGAVLKGSSRAADYPMKKGYRLYPYSNFDRPPSLINALSSNKEPGAFENIRITGKGSIDGNGWKFARNHPQKDELGNELPLYQASNNARYSNDGILPAEQIDAAVKEGINVKDAYGQRRSSLITLRGVRNVYIEGVRILNPGFHGIMFLECENATVNAVTHHTFNTGNGDGIEFGNSRNAMVYNNFFDTGDDCVNFAAGTGIEAEKQHPMHGAYIFNNYFRNGHGAVAIGSHTGAWIEDVLAEDNIVNGSWSALRCKSTLINGGGARRITFRDTAVKNVANQVYVFTLDYFDQNAAYDYKPSRAPGKFRDITVSGNSVENSAGNAPSIQVQGDAAKNGWHENISFINVRLRKTNPAMINALRTGVFRNVEFIDLKDSNLPWTVTKSEKLSFEGSTPKP